MKKVVLAFLLTISIATIAQEVQAQQPLTLEASYIGDNVNNLSGGIKKGSNYLGMANFRIGFDFGKAGMWKGGQFFINAAHTHGESPSAELIGDMQVASNIEAGYHTYLQEIWIKQALGNVELTLGLQDLNVEFANTEHGSLYLNRSFGIVPLISNNFSAPIFPLTTVGLTARWNVNPKLSWINAIYDGSPTEFDYNPYNLKWKYNSGDGMLAVTEFQYLLNTSERPVTVKLGAFSHNHLAEKTFNKDLPDSVAHNLFGIYGSYEHKLWVRDNRSLGFFMQGGFSPCAKSTNDVYLGAGFNFGGLFSDSGKDILGVAFANEHLKGMNSSETAIELTYQYQITENIMVQPDIQYIINPSGTGVKLSNSLTGNIRFGIFF